MSYVPSEGYNVREVLGIIRDHPGIETFTLADKLGCSVSIALWVARTLRERGLVENDGCRWTVK